MQFMGIVAVYMHAIGSACHSCDVLLKLYVVSNHPVYTAMCTMPCSDDTSHITIC